MALIDQLQNVATQAGEIHALADSQVASLLSYLNQGRTEPSVSIGAELTALATARNTILTQLFSIRTKVVQAIQTQGP